MPETAPSAEEPDLRPIARVIAFVIVATDVSVFLVLSVEFVYPAVETLPMVDPIAVGAAVLFLALYAVPHVVLAPMVATLLEF